MYGIGGPTVRVHFALRMLNLAKETPFWSNPVELYNLCILAAGHLNHQHPY